MAERFIIARNPGQGSQFEGMGGVAGDVPEAEEVFDKATRLLHKNGRKIGGDYVSLRQLCLEPGMQEKLDQNHYTQLAIFASTVAAQRRLRAAQPELTVNAWAGHSIGEYAALVDAGVLSFQDALLLVEARARYMTEAGRIAEKDGKPGGIGVVLGMDLADVEPLARAHNSSIANYNSPSQIGVSGAQNDLKGLKDAVEEAGKKFVDIPVSVAVHSSYMNYAKEHLRAYIGDGHEFNDPAAESMILNRTGEFATSGQEIARLAPEQVSSPVLWYPGMEIAISRAGSAEVVLLEVGAKSVLNGIDKHFKRSHPNVQLVDFETALAGGLDA